MANLRVNEITTGVGSYNGSIHAGGTGAYLLTTVTAPGTDDFTIECYINTDQASGSNQDGIFAINASSGGFQSNTTNQIRLTLGRDGTDGQNGGLEVNIVGTSVGTGDGNDIIQEGTWHHVAVTRASGTVKIWVDGVEKASGSAAGDVDGTTFITGYYDSLYTYQGFMSNFRYRKGTAHYTTTFTAPTKPLERTSDTELIFAQSSHNAGNGFSSAIHGGTTDIMQVNGNVTANESSPTQLSDTSAVGVVYDGPIKHNTQGYMYFPTGRTEERGRGRGLYGGGVSPSGTDRISLIDIYSQGNSIRFGALTRSSTLLATCSSKTRGLWGGDYPSAANTIDFVTIATNGNAQDFGDLTDARFNFSGCGNDTRGLFGGGHDPSVIDVIDFVTIASTGNATDFGNLLAGCNGVSSASSPTRGLWFGGDTGSKQNVIQFVTIATTGNAQDFGDMQEVKHNTGSLSSQTRALVAGGNTGSFVDTIDFVEIATTGNGTDFGNLTQGRQGLGTVSNSLRGVFAAGLTPSNTNRMDFVTIASTGDATQFGDLDPVQTHFPEGCSDSHGGLS